MVFRPAYALAAAILLVTEALIARFLHDPWIRPHGGDVLAVMLVYAALRTVTRLPRRGAALAGFAIGTAIELAQLVHVLDLIGAGGDPIARTVLGSAFDWSDIAAYGAGAVLSVVIDRRATS